MYTTYTAQTYQNQTKNLLDSCFPFLVGLQVAVDEAPKLQNKNKLRNLKHTAERKGEMEKDKGMLNRLNFLQEVLLLANLRPSYHATCTVTLCLPSNRSVQMRV